jgi:hypothetical protein
LLPELLGGTQEKQLLGNKALILRQNLKLVLQLFFQLQRNDRVELLGMHVEKDLKKKK